MENKSSKSKTKRRLFATLFSIVLCMLLIGVSVYAATSQSAKITNSITISSSQQTRTDVVVSWVNGPATEERLLYATSTALPAEGYTEAVNKPYNEDNKTGTGPDIQFSYSNMYTYVVYKMEFNNRSTDKDSTITININNQDETPTAYEFNEQVSIYFGKEGALSEASFIADSGYSLTGSVAKQTQEVYYLVVALNKDIADVSAVSIENYDILINVA